jgi:hypothetical protein
MRRPPGWGAPDARSRGSPGATGARRVRKAATMLCGGSMGPVGTEGAVRWVDGSGGHRGCCAVGRRVPWAPRVLCGGSKGPVGTEGAVRWVRWIPWAPRALSGGSGGSRGHRGRCPVGPVGDRHGHPARPSGGGRGQPEAKGSVHRRGDLRLVRHSLALAEDDPVHDEPDPAVGERSHRQPGRQVAAPDAPYQRSPRLLRTRGRQVPQVPAARLGPFHEGAGHHARVTGQGQGAGAGYGVRAGAAVSGSGRGVGRSATASVTTGLGGTSVQRSTPSR